MAVRARGAVACAAVFHEPIAVIIDAIAADLRRGLTPANHLTNTGNAGRPTRTHRIARTRQRSRKLGARPAHTGLAWTAAIRIGTAVAAA